MIGKNKFILGILIFLLISTVIIFYSRNNHPDNKSDNFNINKFVSQNINKLQKSVVLEVLGANFDANYKKIPYDVRNIDIMFSDQLKADTVNKDTFQINPYVDGKLSLMSGNIIRYALNAPLIQGKEYTISISRKIESIYNNQLNNDYTYFLEAVAGVKVTKIYPVGDTDNLSQNIAVFYNMPVVPLTNLDQKDKLPCPIEIAPALTGICKWTTSSVVEFIPTNNLNSSTDYQVKVVSKPGLLYPIATSTGVTIKTPRLVVTSPDIFNPTEGIKLKFNYPVNITDLQSKIEVYNKFLTGNIGTGKLDIQISNMKNSDQEYLITLKNNNFIYNNSYFLVINKGVAPVIGNVPLENNYSKIIKSANFLDHLTIYKKNISATGIITEDYRDSNSYRNFTGNIIKYNIIPSNTVFELDFEEEVALDKAYFTISSTTDNMDYKIYYKQEEITQKINGQDVTTKVDNKKIIRIEPVKPFVNNSLYSLTISKNINKAIIQDIIAQLPTSDRLQLLGFKFISYNKSCVYLNNEISNEDILDYLDPKAKNYQKITISPNAKIASFNVRLVDQITDGECPLLYETGNFLPGGNGNYIIYNLNTRLNPHAKYQIAIHSGLEDKYGNKLGVEFTKDVETQGLNEIDKYIYTAQNKHLNVIPANLPITLNTQSINMDEAYVEVCQINVDKNIELIGDINNGLNYYGDISNKVRTFDNCTKITKKTLPLKNNYWNYTNNRFDIEKDIIGNKFSQNLIIVRGSIDKVFDDNLLEHDKAFLDIYLRTNLFVALEKGDNKNILLATDLSGQQVITDLQFDFYKKVNNQYQKVNLEVKYNPIQQVYEFDNVNFDILIVKNNNYFGLINKNKDFLDNNDFGYSVGEGTSEKKYLYLYTDRPLYKPGDTVYFKGLLRQFNFNGFYKTDILTGTLKVLDNNNVSIQEIPIIVDKNSNFNGEFNIPAGVPLGEFKFEFKVFDINIRTNATFSIEEYKKPVFKIAVQSDKNDVQLGDKIQLKIAPTYYFGGKLINTVGHYGILTQNYYFDAKDYSDYQFGIGYDYFNCIYWDNCQYSDNLSAYSGFNINENGELFIDYNFNSSLSSGEKIFTFNFEIQDPNTNKTVNQDKPIILHNTDGYVGIRSTYWNSKNSGINFSGVVLDWNAKAKANSNVQVQLIKKNRLSVKKQDVDGVFYWDYTLQEKLESENNFISDNKGLFNGKFNPTTDGDYTLKAIYKGANNKTFISSLDIYVAGESYVEWRQGNNDMTTMVADKNILNIGDTQEYVLQSPVNTGKVLVVIEKDDSILDYFVSDLKSYADKIQIPVKGTYYPNFYVKAFLIGSIPGNPLPIYKRALTVTKVNTEYKQLKVDVKTDKQYYKTRDKIKIEIKVVDTQGNPIENANGTISIVDESLLALKGNPKQNPYAYFYDMKRYLGTLSYTSLKDIIQKLEVKDMTHGEKGGDGDNLKGGKSKKKRGIFKDTAYWNANFTTDKDGYFTIQTDELPDNLTTWVIEVLVNTPDTNKLGVNRTSVMTNQKVMINDNLPGFFGSNDKIVLGPVVFNKSGKSSDFEVTLSGTNIKLTENKKKIFIKDNESQTVNFELTVADIGINEDQNTFLAKLDIKAVDLSTNDSDEIEKYVEIKESSTPEYVSTIGKTDQSSYDEHIQIGDIMNNAGILKINYSATLLNSLLAGIDFLNKYPYGCAEQKTSAIMPNIYIKKLYNAANQEFDLDKKMISFYEDKDEGIVSKSIAQVINEYLVEIQKFQNKDGGFLYWYDSSLKISDFWLSSYILQSLADIKSIGFKPQEEMLANLNAYLKNKFYQNQIEGCTSNNEQCQYPEIYRTYAISAILTYDQNDYDAYKMWQLLDINKLSATEKLEYAKVIGKLLQISAISAEEKNNLLQIGINIINKIIQEDLVFNPRGAYLGKSVYASRLINTVNLINAISEIGITKFAANDTIIDNIIRWVIAQKKNGSFGSTQDNIQVINALTNYLAKSNNLQNIKLFAKLKLNGNNVDEQEINDQNKFEIFSKNIKLNALQADNIFNIQKIGSGLVYYDLSLSYYLPAHQIKPRDEGISVMKIYYDFTEYNKIKTLKQSEWESYLSGSKKYSDLKYPKGVEEYLTPISGGNIGQLIYVFHKIITSETRDKVAFEGFIPAGTELVNTNLKTESAQVKNLAQENIFEKVEYRTDRLFGYTDKLYPGIYNFSYVIRLTHSGEYNVKPTIISEFYNPEVFGRTQGEKFKVK